MKKAMLMMLLAVCTCTIQAQQREVKLPPKPQQHGYRDYSTQDKGFWCAVEVDGGSSIMVGSRNMQYVNLTYTAGYRLNEYLREQRRSTQFQQPLLHAPLCQPAR